MGRQEPDHRPVFLSVSAIGSSALKHDIKVLDRRKDGLSVSAIGSSALKRGVVLMHDIAVRVFQYPPSDRVR